MAPLVVEVMYQSGGIDYHDGRVQDAFQRTNTDVVCEDLDAKLLAIQVPLESNILVAFLSQGRSDLLCNSDVHCIHIKSAGQLKLCSAKEHFDLQRPAECAANADGRS